MNVACNELTSGLGEDDVSLEDVVALLDTVDQRVSSLKGKVSSNQGAVLLPGIEFWFKGNHRKESETLHINTS